MNSKADVMIIAQTCHEANRAFCLANGQDPQPAWQELEGSENAWMIDASIAGVKFRLENPDAPASAQHDQWMQEKRDTGWVYGAIKDGDKKTHPLLIPYEDLPLVERKKDALFGHIVTALK